MQFLYVVWKSYLKDSRVGEFHKHSQNWAFEIYGSSWTSTIDDRVLSHIGVSEEIRVNVAFLKSLNIPAGTVDLMYDKTLVSTQLWCTYNAS